MQQSITFDTTKDTIDEVAEAIAYAYGYNSMQEALDDVGSVDSGAESTIDATYPGGWTRSKMTRYVRALQPTAQAVLRAIAEGAPAAEADAVQEAAGVDGFVFAGSMSSFGFAVRNTRGVGEKPFRKVQRTYEMDNTVAALAIETLDHLGL
jgi:hypothetical protein